MTPQFFFLPTRLKIWERSWRKHSKQSAKSRRETDTDWFICCCVSCY